jgi:methylmalonyl-CoA mutase N-terminal domain/subunit
VSRVKAFKAAQNPDHVGGALEAVEAAARGDANLLPVMKDALKNGATIGQVAGRLRAVFGEYRPA